LVPCGARRFSSRAKGKKPKKSSEKAATKPLTESWMKSVGLPTQKPPKPFFSVVENPFFSDTFYPLGGFFFSVGRLFAAFLAERDCGISPSFFPRGLFSSTGRQTFLILINRNPSHHFIFGEISGKVQGGLDSKTNFNEQERCLN
jgi:hypothetical protein